MYVPCFRPSFVSLWRHVLASIRRADRETHDVLIPLAQRDAAKFREEGSFQRGVLSEWIIGWEDESAITGETAKSPEDPHLPILW